MMHNLDRDWYIYIFIYLYIQFYTDLNLLKAPDLMANKNCTFELYAIATDSCTMI